MLVYEMFVSFKMALAGIFYISLLHIGGSLIYGKRLVPKYIIIHIINIHNGKSTSAETLCVTMLKG